MSSTRGETLIAVVTDGCGSVFVEDGLKDMVVTTITAPLDDDDTTVEALVDTIINAVRSALLDQLRVH